MVPEFDFERARSSASDGFSLLQEALELAEAQLIEVGTNLARKGMFADVAGLIPVRNGLSHLREAVERLNGQFFATLDPDGSNEEGNEDQSFGNSLRVRTRGPNKSLSVTLWDGRLMRNSSAAHTFSAVIREFGWDLVESLGIEMSGIPLVSRIRHPYYESKKIGHFLLDGWYVMTNSDTERKAQLLKDISDALGKKIDVHVDND